MARFRLLLLSIALSAATMAGCPGGGADADADGIPDAQDNCPSRANRDQRDSNDDGIGDACEAVESGRPADESGGVGGGGTDVPDTTDPNTPPGDDDTDAIDLNGKWDDSGREVCITQVGSAVYASYLEPYVCDHRDGTGQTSSTDYDFSGTLTGSTIVGEITVCNYGEGNPLGVGIAVTAFNLVVSADGQALSGTWIDELEGQNVPLYLTQLAESCPADEP